MYIPRGPAYSPAAGRLPYSRLQYMFPLCPKRAIQRSLGSQTRARRAFSIIRFSCHYHECNVWPLALTTTFFSGGLTRNSDCNHALWWHLNWSWLSKKQETMTATMLFFGTPYDFSRTTLPKKKWWSARWLEDTFWKRKPAAQGLRCTRSQHN